MHHKNNRFSSANHNNPQHEKPKYPSNPVPEARSKESVLTRIRQRFQEKPATEAEVKQLRLDTVREELKTRKTIAKQSRPSRFSGFGGGQSSTPSYRRGSKIRQEEPSFLFGGGGKSTNSFLDFGSGPSLSFLTGESGKKSKNQKSGLEEMF